MSGRAKLIVTLILAGVGVVLVVAVVCGGALAYRQVTKPEVIVWDFTHGHTPAAVHWPATVPGAEFERKGRFDLTIIGDDGRVRFHEEVERFYIEREGDKLKWTVVHFGRWISVEQAYAKAKKIMMDCSYEPHCFELLERWHADLRDHRRDARPIERDDPLYA